MVTCYESIGLFPISRGMSHPKLFLTNQMQEKLSHKRSFFFLNEKKPSNALTSGALHIG